MNIEQWKSEYAARLMSRGGMPKAEAEESADCAADAQDDDHGDDVFLWPSPVEAADEEMSYWDDPADE